jgi:putative transposase
MVRESEIWKTCKRYDVPGDAHELTFSCYRNQPFLLVDRTRLWLVDAIEAAREKHRFHLWAWVFMPEHVHLLIWPATSNYSIGNILQSIKQPVGRFEITRAKKMDGERLDLMATGLTKPPFRFWQEGGGYDKNMTADKTIRNAVEYIHNNPVRKGLVDSPEKWIWSSYKDWLDIGECPLAVDKDSFP